MNEHDVKGRFVKEMIPWNFGVSPSEETKQKMSEADRGRKISEETREKHRKQMIGNQKLSW